MNCGEINGVLNGRLNETSPKRSAKSRPKSRGILRINDFRSTMNYYSTDEHFGAFGLGRLGEMFSNRSDKEHHRHTRLKGTGTD